MNRSLKSTASKLVRIVVTTGDPDGIGWEVAAKALNALGPTRGVQFTVFRDPRAKKLTPQIGRKFRHKVTTYSLREALKFPPDHHTLIEVHSTEPAAIWVEEATRACLRRDYQALVTGPLSKTSILAAGLKDIGHTEILGRLSGRQDLFMGFIGKHFNVVLTTGHQPLREAISILTPERLSAAMQAARLLRRTLPKARQLRPLALVGLNPHAGEQGLIGSEESWFRDAVLACKDVEGPLVPDAAFLPANWKKYSVYVVPYHDQGLIPFKLVHGFGGGVHLTLNLPFVRTSVDHGTAKELYGRNKAQAGSMRDALLTAIRLCEGV